MIRRNMTLGYLSKIVLGFFSIPPETKAISLWNIPFLNGKEQISLRI
jgi:hypothetical protein